MYVHFSYLVISFLQFKRLLVTYSVLGLPSTLVAEHKIEGVRDQVLKGIF
jgi:hypothetical protein